MPKLTMTFHILISVIFTAIIAGLIYLALMDAGTYMINWNIKPHYQTWKLLCDNVAWWECDNEQ